MGARGAAGAQSPARGVRAPRTMAPGRGGDAGTVALAALVRRAGAVAALEPLPARSASARSPGRGPGSSVRGLPRGALSAPPRPAPPFPLAAFSPSKFVGGRPTAVPPCFPASQARRPSARREKADCFRGTRDPRREWRPRQPSRGRALPGNFLSGCQRLRLRGRGASRPQLSPPFSSPPARLSPPSPARVLLPEGALARALLPSPRGGSTTDQYNRPPPPSPMEPKQSLLYPRRLLQRGTGSGNAGTLGTRVSVARPLLCGLPTTPEATRAPRTAASPSGREMHGKINCSSGANKQAGTEPTGARARRDPLLQGSRGGRGEPAAGAQRRPAKRSGSGRGRKPQS